MANKIDWVATLCRLLPVYARRMSQYRRLGINRGDERMAVLSVIADSDSIKRIDGVNSVVWNDLFVSFIRGEDDGIC